jgi:hypothetical protein
MGLLQTFKSLLPATQAVAPTGMTTSRRHPMARAAAEGEQAKLSLLSTSEIKPAIERMMDAEMKLEKFL